jgi:hypothetical protein
VVAGDGNTTRKHLETIWKKTGVKPKDLENDCPEIFEQLWLDFIRLDSKRTSNGFGANPLLDSEIESWCRLNKVSLSVFELELIEKLDRKKLEFTAKQSEK